MKLIFDRTQDDAFPIEKLVQLIGTRTPLPPDAPLNIDRLGGVGGKIWEYEARLDQGEQLTVTTSELLDLIGAHGAAIDELRCAVEGVLFGVSDASFMFLQMEDKNKEQEIASMFSNVKDRPDH